MIYSVQTKIKKELPFNAEKIEDELKKKYGEILRWAVINVTDEEFYIDAAVEE